MRCIPSNVNVFAVKSVEDILEGKNGFNIIELPDDTLNLFALNWAEFLTSDWECLFPGKLLERSVLLSEHRDVESLLSEAVEGMPSLIADPLLIDFIVDSGKNSHSVWASSMNVNVTAEAIHNIDAIVGLEFPRSSGEWVGEVVQGTDWTKVNNISRKFVSDHALNIGWDLVGLASADLAKSELSSNLLGKSDASGAVNASSHGGLNEGSDVLVLNGSLILHHSAFSVTVDGRDVLKIALTTLVADGTVEGMVSQ
jgi:hypothetical protein